MNKTKTIVTVVVLILIAGGWWYYTKNKTLTPTPTDSTPIKIGVIYGFTGAASTWADMGKKGIDLAVKEINEGGGVNGQPLEIVYEDSQTNPAKSVSAFTKLVTTDKVSLVAGDLWSFLTNPLMPLAANNKITLISPTVMDASVEKPNSYFFSMGHTVESQRAALEEFFMVNPEVKTISVLCWNDAWGNANKNLLLDIAQKRNIRVVSSECTADFSATYQSEITKIKAANPDAIYFNTSLPDVVLRKIKDLGLGNKKVLTLSPAVDAIEVNKTPVAYLKNVYFANWTPNQDFTNKFQKAYGVMPIIEAQNHYDMIRAVAMGFKNNPSDLKAGLKRVKFTGVEGYAINFTQADQIRVNGGQAQLYIYDGQYKLVNKYDSK